MNIKIPDGYEIDETEESILIDKQMFFNWQHKPHLVTLLKKKQPKQKSFEIYIDEYLKQLDCNYFSEYCDDNEGLFGNRFPFVFKSFNTIPFEYRIGLLRFICEDLGIIFYQTSLYTILKSCDSQIEELREICPKEFLETFK